MICHQKMIVNSKAALDSKRPYNNLNLFYVKEITKKESKQIILEYEWLGTMGRAFACYGLFINEELHGAINFGLPSSPESRNICGKEMSSKAICLERGACSHLAPPNAASFFIKRAIKQANKKYGWEIYYAYSDEEAGEIGTIYQACNWYYIGQGVGRRPGRKRECYLTPENELVSERTLRRRFLKKKEILRMGWKVIEKLPKHKYVWFEGSKTRKNILKNLCRYNFKKYPKKDIILPPANIIPVFHNIL